MFTGIVVEQGVVERTGAARSCSHRSWWRATWRSATRSSVDGCCLTVTEVDGTRLRFDAVPETLARTILGDRVAGDVINLEPAMRVGDRMGGHWVQGHVDGVGAGAPSLRTQTRSRCGSTRRPGASLRDREGLDRRQRRQPDRDGIRRRGFGVSLIPHTLEVTNFGRCETGDRVNLEADLFGKYVERLATGGVPSEQDER